MYLKTRELKRFSNKGVFLKNQSINYHFILLYLIQVDEKLANLFWEQ